MDFGYSVAGFIVGAIVGLTGVGGGSLMTPLLVLMFGIHPAKAVGTDLLYAAITKAGGTWVHASKGTVNWKITGLLASGSMPATAITLLAVHHFAPGGFGNATKLISHRARFCPATDRPVPDFPQQAAGLGRLAQHDRTQPAQAPIHSLSSPASPWGYWFP